jgi:hypothetical protein
MLLWQYYCTCMPFDVKVEAVLTKLKMEITNLQCDTDLKNAV